MFCRRALLLVIGLAGLSVPAEVFRVLPGEDVQAALDRAAPGDTVRLAPGVHRRRLVMARGGEFGRPLVLEGEPGAILDGSEPVELRWEPAEDIAPGVWRCSLPFLPFLVTVEGRVVTMLREGKTDPAQVKDPEWHWPRIFHEGIGRSRWDGVRALGLYRGQERELLLKFGDLRDPRGLPMTVAPKAPCVHVIGAHRCVVRSLAMRYAAYGVLVENSIGTVVEDCTIGPVDYCVWLDAGAYKCTIRFNEMFQNPYAVSSPWEEGSWDNWKAHKTGGFSDRYGVQIHRTLGWHEVHDNSIHDIWGGIEDRGGPGENVGLNIHHNRIHRINDDGLEPNGAGEHCRWHSNIVSECICGFRVKQIKVGPLYAYRNIFFHNKEDYRNYGEVELQPAWVYVYHNTSTSRRAIQSNKVFGIGTPNYHFYNNLFHCQAWWGNSGNSVEPNWSGDFNVYSPQEAARGWDEDRTRAAALGLDRNSLWTPEAPGFRDLAAQDVSLVETSPARGRGGDLRALFGFAVPGLPEGANPDAGALQFGEPMPVLPRRREDVPVVEAGLWPAADDAPPLPWTGPNLLVNGDFAAGLAGWNAGTGCHWTEGDRFVRVTRIDGSTGMSRLLEGLVPGERYCLVYRSRRSTGKDMRIILRELTQDRYIASAQGWSGDHWQQTVLGFVCPLDAALRLEISPRDAGSCDLGAFAVYRAADLVWRLADGGDLPVHPGTTGAKGMH
ncbi:MAG: hypothetical protein JXR77_16340 [Lentisphaeria bacterium]|nr:hypothetical protein [Lentisphaeria bacterium]